jgi:PilZ domain-containing protein
LFGTTFPVDPHIEQPGLSPGAQQDDGADYLRRLKTGASDAASPTPSTTIVVPAATHSPTFRERRRSPRFQCSGSAEFQPEGSEVRMWGTLTDVSLHGCYVEMNNTFPLGTRMSLTLQALGVRAHVQGTVRVSYPFLGMGVCFSEIEPGQRVQLEQLLAALSRRSSPSSSASTAVPFANSTCSLANVDTRTMLDELAQFFRGNPLLSRDEFYRIAERVGR